MSPTRFLARPMLAAVFVTSGIDVLRNPGPRVAKAEPVAAPLAAKIGLPQDTELLVRINAATHVVAGSMLALGKFRRLSALALLASMVPTTYAGHRFWESEEPQERAQQQSHFLKNVALMGGLLLEAVDTEGRPSVGWRSKRAARRAATAAAAAVPVSRTAGKAAKGASALGAAGAAQSALTARTLKGVAETVGKAKGASVAADRAVGLARSAAKADLVAGTAVKAKKLATQAAKAEVVTDAASRARDLAEAAAKLKVTKELTGKAAEMVNSLDAPAKLAAATLAARRVAS